MYKVYAGMEGQVGQWATKETNVLNVLSETNALCKASISLKNLFWDLLAIRVIFRVFQTLIQDPFISFPDQ